MSARRFSAERVGWLCIGLGLMLLGFVVREWWWHSLAAAYTGGTLNGIGLVLWFRGAFA